MRDLEWSVFEKAIAREAFNRALSVELREIIEEAKHRAARINEPADVWRLESWLTRPRLETDRKYHCRYSVRPLVFASLAGQGRVSREDLQGLGLEKISLIFGS